MATAEARLSPEIEARAADLSRRYRETRAFSERICAPLEIEDYVVQSMPDASPAKWHLAHTSWFFETFVLRLAGEAPIHASYEVLFNSYYNTVGEQFPRPRRGLLTRPTVGEVLRYRRRVDELLLERLASPLRIPMTALDVIELGVHHEQQHQELLVTDLKHLLAQNPLCPAYRAGAAPAGAAPALSWRAFGGGLCEIGFAGEGFAFDNEGPRHRIHLEPFALASRPVTNGEYLQFIEDGGYRRPELWLSEGWETVRAQDWSAPLYWDSRDSSVFTLAGRRPLGLGEPVCHVSYYEADAYARWAGARLPGEGEWETAAAGVAVEGNFADTAADFHPRPALDTGDELVQLFGDVWEWTQSPYVAYPGYRPPAGALGEYNGKFMCNQQVLRGGSCATPRGHVRASYRNFFPAAARWQFSGIRLARDA